MHLPTSNGEHFTGDGFKMSEAICARNLEVVCVQKHPTDLEKPDNPDAKIKYVTTEALSHKLLKYGLTCICLIFAKAGKYHQEYGPLFLASGGIGPNYLHYSLLAQYCPISLLLPTINGEHFTGDGFKMSEAICARSLDLEWVQEHPTDPEKPDDPNTKINFLTTEALSHKLLMYVRTCICLIFAKTGKYQKEVYGLVFLACGGIGPSYSQFSC